MCVWHSAAALFENHVVFYRTTCRDNISKQSVAQFVLLVLAVGQDSEDRTVLLFL